MMTDVPCPELIEPAEIVQLNVGVTCGSPPLTVTTKVRTSPTETESGQDTLTVGHFACDG
jgi:hypothetical protein